MTFSTTETKASLQLLASDPGVEHLERLLGLVIGEHVSTSESTQERQSARGADITSMVTVRNPLLVLLLLHLGLTRPGQGNSPGLVAHPVANVIGIT